MMMRREEKIIDINAFKMMINRKTDDGIKRNPQKRLFKNFFCAISIPA